MAFVIDASVTLPWFLEDERSAFTDSLLESMFKIDFWAPSIWCLEVPNALLIAERKRRILPAKRLEYLAQAARLRIKTKTRTAHVDNGTSQSNGSSCLARLKPLRESWAPPQLTWIHGRKKHTRTMIAPLRLIRLNISASSSLS